MSALVLCYFIKVMECISSAIRELFEVTFLDSAWCLVRIALKLIRFREPSYIGLKSGTGLIQLKPVAAVAGFSKFSKPAPPTPNACRLVLSMILGK